MSLPGVPVPADPRRGSPIVEFDNDRATVGYGPLPIEAQEHVDGVDPDTGRGDPSRDGTITVAVPISSRHMDDSAETPRLVIARDLADVRRALRR